MGNCCNPEGSNDGNLNTGRYSETNKENIHNNLKELQYGGKINKQYSEQEILNDPLLGKFASNIKILRTIIRIQARLRGLIQRKKIAVFKASIGLTTVSSNKSLCVFKEINTNKIVRNY